MKTIWSVCVVMLAIGCAAIAAIGQDTAPKMIRGGVLNGKAVSLPKPVYPVDARTAGIEAVVKVEVTIDENGNVESALAIKDETVDNELSTETVDRLASLREAAERAALEAKFSPTLLSGQPVKVTGTIIYNFRLGGPADDSNKILDGGELSGRAVSLPAAKYPGPAKAVRATGPVAVRVTVDEEGNVISAKAVSGHPLLQSAAVAAAREARFEPALLDGRPVKLSGIITYNFALPGKNQ